MQQPCSIEYEEEPLNGKDKEMSECPLQPDLAKVTSAINLLAGKVDSLLDLHRWVIKWLLIVVCIIALGRSAIDLGKDWFISSSKVHAEDVHHDGR